MRRELVILLVLCSVFMAIGCAEQGAEEGPAGEEPAEEATPVEAVTPGPTVTPVDEEAATEETPGLPINGETVEVMIEDNAFNPATVNISAGDTVRWTNLDSTPHAVRGPTFGIENLGPGASYEFLFTDQGTYEYYCSIHPEMRGTVIVEEE
ncbi:cupredoxin family copper-binding protein [Methanosarcina hadiensis]|uniref:cupredoxin domain-containing protein n=1 Tax=Methanosarcina hadiensis TaxID=3078083 RepID=UPI003977DA92